MPAITGSAVAGSAVAGHPPAIATPAMCPSSVAARSGVLPAIATPAMCPSSVAARSGVSPASAAPPHRVQPGRSRRYRSGSPLLASLSDGRGRTAGLRVPVRNATLGLRRRPAPGRFARLRPDRRGWSAWWVSAREVRASSPGPSGLGGVVGQRPGGSRVFARTVGAEPRGGSAPGRSRPPEALCATTSGPCGVVRPARGGRSAR